MQRVADAQFRHVEFDVIRGHVTLGDRCFDLIVHPVANCFVPDVRPIWRGCAAIPQALVWPNS